MPASIFAHVVPPILSSSGALTDPPASTRKRSRSPSLTPPRTKRARMQAFSFSNSGTQTFDHHSTSPLSVSTSLPALDASHSADSSSPISSPATPRDAGLHLDALLPAPSLSGELGLVSDAYEWKMQRLFPSNADQGAEVIYSLLSREQERVTGFWKQRTAELELGARDMQDRLTAVEEPRRGDRGQLEAEIQRLKKKLDCEVKIKVGLQKEVAGWEEEKKVWLNGREKMGRKREAGVMTDPTLVSDQGVQPESVQVDVQPTTSAVSRSTSGRKASTSSKRKHSVIKNLKPFFSPGDERREYKKTLKQKEELIAQLEEEKKSLARTQSEYRLKRNRERSRLEEQLRQTTFDADRKVKEANERRSDLEKAMKKARLRLVDGCFSFS